MSDAKAADPTDAKSAAKPPTKNKPAKPVKTVKGGKEKTAATAAVTTGTGTGSGAGDSKDGGAGGEAKKKKARGAVGKAESADGLRLFLSAGIVLENELPDMQSITHMNITAAITDQPELVTNESGHTYKPKPRRLPQVFTAGTVWYVEEKIDGSQFSFRLIERVNMVVFKTKNRYISEKTIAWNSVFTNSMTAIADIKQLLNPAYIYRGEAICRPHHGVVVYDRAPTRYVVLFEIVDTKTGKCLLPTEKAAEAKRLGLMCSPLLYASDRPNDFPIVTAAIAAATKSAAAAATVTTAGSGGGAGTGAKELSDERIALQILAAMESGAIKSCLGDVKPEGLVVKNYSVAGGAVTAGGGGGALAMLKLVREEFREELASDRNLAEAATRAATPEQLIQILGKQYAVAARYRKAVQHYTENRGGGGGGGGGAGSVSGDDHKLGHADLGALSIELDNDLYKEAREQIATALMGYFFPKIASAARADFTEWFQTDVMKLPPKLKPTPPAAADGAGAGAGAGAADSKSPPPVNTTKTADQKTAPPTAAAAGGGAASKK